MAEYFCNLCFVEGEMWQSTSANYALLKGNVAEYFCNLCFVEGE